MAKLLDKSINWGISTLVFLLPLFFLPITTEFYEFNKNILLYCFTSLLLIVWGLKMIAEKRVVFKRTPFDLPVLLFAGSFLLSTLFASANKWESLWTPGGTGTIIALTLLYFLITNNLTKDTPLYKGVSLSIAISASLLALIAIYQFIGVGEAFAPVDWLKAKTFSPAGGSLVLATFLIVSLTLALTRIYTDWKTPARQASPGEAGGDRHGSSLYLNIIVSLLLASGLGVAAYQLLTTFKPILLPQAAGWVIALEAFKRFPFFGVGPENFISAFSLGKPIGLNATQFWALRFGVSSNFYFHLLTTVGILGLGAWLFLVLRVVKIGVAQFTARQEREMNFAIPLSLGLIFILFAFLPANFLLLTTFYLLLALLGATLITGEIKEESKILPQIIFIIVLLVVGVSFYAVGRVFAAELFFKKSLDAAAANRGTDTYNLQIKTIQTNPYNDVYRIAYSQTNLALANAIASNPPAGGLTDQDRQNINQLVQQGIREAKVAIALGPTKASSWENLAAIYRSLINFAQGADQWTIDSYQQAIFLDPANPILRVNLGGVFYALANYDEAIRQFTIAVNLKPDFANGHYNLAAAYREKGEIAEAVREMEQAQALVEPGSNDYQKTSQELADLRARLPKEEKEASPSGTPETLTPPATPPAGIKPPLTLPEEAAPQVGTPSGR